MQEIETQVKETLYKIIYKKEKEIKSLFIQNKFSKIIGILIDESVTEFTKSSLSEKKYSYPLMTGILHYMLTNCIIPSNRKITSNGIKLDIVIPDLKTLKNTPEDALVILIPKNTSKKYVQSEIIKITNIQPKKENIWVILNKKISIDNKIFLLNENFITIIDEIKNFLRNKNFGGFKILKIK